MWKDGRILRLVLFLFVVGSIKCQPWLRPRHPLCVSQFALANRACTRLPIYTVPPPSPPPAPPIPPPAPIVPPPVPLAPPAPLGPPVPLPPPTPLVPPVPLPPDPLPPSPQGHHHHHHHHHEDNDDDQDGNENHHHGHHSSHHHASDKNENPHYRHDPSYTHHHSHHHTNGTHHHHHENGHHHHHHNHDRRQVQEVPATTGSPNEQECCHWLGQIDTDCVCDILVNLPPFLSRPLHEYTVIVDHVCNVTFACPSRIRL